ncbi:MAG: glycosyltransferase family 9 protein [Elusimicrobiota bacterium]|jgi:ADP-heptose:LPS heptosyltransferase|nr:glycosyltransferase family 9 protein [Elusimicrobiota bacterium]
MGKFNEFSRSIRSKIGKFLFDKKQRAAKIFDFSKVETILFIRNDGKIGDMVVATFAFREIKKAYPQKKLFVLCTKNNKKIIEQNPYVDEIYETSGQILKDLSVYKKIRSKKPDLTIELYEFDIGFFSLFALRFIASKFLIGLYKKHYNLFDLSIEADFFSKHVTQRYESVLRLLGIENSVVSYDIFIGDGEEKEVEKFIESTSAKTAGTDKILINPFSSSKHKCFDFNKLMNLIRLIEKSKLGIAYILCDMRKNFLTRNIKNIERVDSGIFVFCSRNILTAAALVKKCDIIVTPDTSIIHIASAFKKKTIGLYLNFSNRQEKSDIIWGPNNPNALIINANLKNKRWKNDIKSIDDDKIVALIGSML